MYADADFAVEVDSSENEEEQDEEADEDDDEHARPDNELLQFHKQRSTPMVQLSEVGHEGENLICEVDDFSKANGGPAQMGMAKAGHEEKVIRQLHKAGSIDASSLL